MPAPLDFYFDFSSPYGYLAATQIDELAARYGREVDWHAILLGATFKVTGLQPLPSIPLKGDYARHDMPRSARFLGIEIRMPSSFPVGTVAVSRAFYWAKAQDPQRAKALAMAMFRAYFLDDINIGEASNVVSVAARAGFDAAAVEAALQDPAVKDQLKQANDRAIERKVFGSPYVLVDGEPFWGVDRLPQIERWLAQGGF